MRRRILPIVLLVVVGGLSIWILTRKGSDRGEMLSGSIEARDADIGSLVSGRVQRVLVDEGQSVRAGETIAVLESSLYAPQVEEQEATVAETRAALERAVRGPRREELERARIAHQVAETDRRRLEALLESGAIAQQQYDAAAARAASTEETLRELERGTRKEDIEAARASLRRQEERLLLLRRQLEETVIRAPSDGVLQSIDLRPGDLVEAGRPVAKLLEPGELWVRVYVPEPRLGMVTVGQGAWITVDTWPDRRFPGRVVEISDRAEYTPRNVQTLDQRSDQVFGVKVAIDPTPELKPGMAAMVELVPGKASPQKPLAEDKVP